MLLDLLRTDPVFRTIVILTFPFIWFAVLWVALVIFNGRSTGSGMG